MTARRYYYVAVQGKRNLKWLYYGHAVVETSRREVAGGTAVDVKRDEANGWPWTVESFTVALSELRERDS